MFDLVVSPTNDLAICQWADQSEFGFEFITLSEHTIVHLSQHGYIKRGTNRTTRPVFQPDGHLRVCAYQDNLDWYLDEDAQHPDHWCSHSVWGQECWQVISQLTWNLRLELGHHLKPEPVRATEIAPALPPSPLHTTFASGYAPPDVGAAWKAGRFSGQDFALQSDGTLHCPADQKQIPHEQHGEADGSLRIAYGARIHSCRPCPLCKQCQWNGKATAKPRQVNVRLHPFVIGSAPLLWLDWSRREPRRACLQLVRYQRIEVSLAPPPVAAASIRTNVILLRTQRARTRLSWETRWRAMCAPQRLVSSPVRCSASQSTLPRLSTFQPIRPTCSSPGFLCVHKHSDHEGRAELLKMQEHLEGARA